MRKTALLFVVLFLVAFSASAFAKDICVNNGSSLIKFDNVRLLKGKTTPLSGEFHPGGGDANLPFIGSVTLDADGVTTRIHIISSYGNGAISCMWAMTGDKSFNASGNFDNVPFASTPDGAETWTNISCASPFPAAGPRASGTIAAGIPE